MYTEDWTVELPMNYKNKPIMCRMNKDYIGFLVEESSG
jgi:hypothetical protein